MKFTVKRKRWARGGKGGEARLLNQASYMCCLGFVGRQCEIPTRSLWDVAAPKETPNQRQWPKWFFWHGEQTRDVKRAMEINDEVGITDTIREKRLSAIFAKHGDELEFIN